MSVTVVPGEHLPVGVAAALVAVALSASLGAGALLSGASPARERMPREEGALAYVPAGGPAASADGAPIAAPVPAGAGSGAEEGRSREPPDAVDPPPANGLGAARAAPVCRPILVGFGVGQALPSERVAARLRELAQSLAGAPASTIVIDGHADSLGSDELNLRLSKRRAQGVAWVLENAGVAKERITSRGFGAYLPIEGSRDDAEVNRRVVIHVRGECVPGFEEVLEP
jgi:outer membrane protein OmpA-like peptidoglycan-associated protein